MTPHFTAIKCLMSNLQPTITQQTTVTASMLTGRLQMINIIVEHKAIGILKVFADIH